MVEFNRVMAHVRGEAVPGRLEALEGGRGFMRVVLEASGVRVGDEVVLEMHDGARFRVVVVESLQQGAHAFRMKLLAKA